VISADNKKYRPTFPIACYDKPKNNGGLEMTVEHGLLFSVLFFAVAIATEFHFNGRFAFIFLTLTACVALLVFVCVKLINTNMGAI
jgi:hypothetical protein